MFQITSESIQRWVRIGLYAAFGALAQHGVTVQDSWKSIAISVVGFAATAAWTMYGSRVNAMLSEIAKVTGIEKVDLQVDPQVIPPKEINAATPTNVVAKPAK